MATTSPKWKLVRDKVPVLVTEAGQTVAMKRVMDDRLFANHLRDKLLEESQELNSFYAEDEGVLKTGRQEEMADILEVIETWAQLWGLDMIEVRDVMDKKRERAGGFEQRLLMEQD